MLRLMLFMSVVSGGTMMFHAMGVLPEDEAFVVAGVIAAVLIFVIPEKGKRRRPEDLIIMLVFIIGVYGIYIKLGQWLATLIDRRIAKAATILLLLLFVVVLLVPNLRRGTKVQTPDAG